MTVTTIRNPGLNLKSELIAYLWLTIAYVITGKLGLMLALPPGYISAIFPPAGIAVAAALIGGRKTWPWIFIASLLLTLWVDYSTGKQLSVLSLEVGSSIAVASLLQAAAGGWILRKVIGYPVELDRLRQVLQFLLLAPVICLISATLSTVSLVALGMVTRDDLLTNWAICWVGDTLGVVLMFPLVMIVAGQPRALWKRRMRTVMGPMLLFFLLFIAIFIKTSQWEDNYTLSDFRQLSQQATNQVNTKLEEQEFLLEQMASLFTRNGQVNITRDEFHRFVQKSLYRFSMIQALEWAPGVDQSQRAGFVTSQRESLPYFDIRGKNTAGQFQRASDHALFYPVTYVEPLAGNEPSVGYDLSSNIVRLAAINLSKKTGKVVASAPVTLVQKSRQQEGLLLLLVVDAHDSKSGLVVSVLRVGDFMDKLLQDARPMLYSRLVDLDENQTIYDNFAPDTRHALYEHTFDFGSRHYRLETAPTPAYIKRHHSWQSWSVLTMGTLGAGLLGALLLVGTGYTARVEAQVEVKTRKLKESAKALILEKQKAEAANEAKGQFLANMSHEIRTPMNGVLGSAYLLEKANLPDEAKAIVRMIRMAGQSLTCIINDILDFSKIEAGHMMLENVPFKLSELFENMANIMSVAAGGKQLELVISPPAGQVENLLGDPLRLGQVLINLVSNAIKFTDQGYVQLAVSLVHETTQNVTLRFSVSDSGIGISAENQQKIFSAFLQADASTSRLFGGTGLGLTISRHLITLMGGELALNSTPGKGSEFCFDLSFEQESIPRHFSLETDSLEILIADDNPITREALRLTAASLCWTATVVDSGDALIRYVQERPGIKKREEVLLIDWQMPGTDGLAAVQTIHGLLGQEPIIIMSTAYAREKLLAQPGSHLVDAVLNKPVTASGLYETVQRVRRARNGSTAPVMQKDAHRLTGLRILVADDSDINRDVAQRIFSGEGAQVMLVNDGRQAVDVLLAHSAEIDIVLMDIQMPVMGGCEATRLIRNIPALAGLPVIALSAGAFIAQQDEAFAAGMTGYIAKPFDVEQAIGLILQLSGRAEPAVLPDRANDRPALLDQTIPGIAVDRGLDIWKEVPIYQQYLRKFARDYRDCVNEMKRLEPVDAAKLAHKLKGAAGNLALMQLADLATRTNRVLRAGEDTADSLRQLQAGLDMVLNSIAHYAAVDITLDQAGSVDSAQITLVLERMLAALDTDRMTVVRPLLAELAAVLSTSEMLSINAAVEAFDFRGGEAAIQLIAIKLGVTLKCKA